MDRKTKVLAGLDLRATTGLEIGPLYAPIVGKSEGSVIYVDHADTDALREKYRTNGAVDVTRIVPVDAVWSGNPLTEAIDGQTVDYVVASHVVEHVPDLIGWLKELSSVLRPDGTIRLVVPDKRFTFDLLRQESRLSDILSAHIAGVKVPQTHLVLDFFLNARFGLTPAEIWLGANTSGMQGNAFEGDPFETALAAAKDAMRTGDYIDVHCWVFTPASFAAIMRSLAERSLLSMECTRFFDTERGKLEFVVHMRPTNDQGKAIDSWHRIELAARRFRKPPVSLAFTIPLLKRLRGTAKNGHAA